jgi:hypothetical protein
MLLIGILIALGLALFAPFIVRVGIGSPSEDHSEDGRDE